MPPPGLIAPYAQPHQGEGLLKNVSVKNGVTGYRVNSEKIAITKNARWYRQIETSVRLKLNCINRFYIHHSQPD